MVSKNLGKRTGEGGRGGGKQEGQKRQSGCVVVGRGGGEPGWSARTTIGTTQQSPYSAPAILDIQKPGPVC